MSLIGNTKKVPLKECASVHAPPMSPPVYFTYPGCKQAGIRIRDLIGAAAPKFVGHGNDPVMCGSHYLRLFFAVSYSVNQTIKNIADKSILQWPGYSNASALIPVDFARNCKSNLAICISQLIVANIIVSPDQPLIFSTVLKAL